MGVGETEWIQARPIKPRQSWRGRVLRGFLVSAAAILLMTGAAKTISALGKGVYINNIYKWSGSTYVVVQHGVNAGT
jgi:hypothetical protein